MMSDLPDSGEDALPLDPELELERLRNANDQRLKQRFESIFAKYSRDFTNVGDEIDISTGDVVVDNGHLEHMRHEVDPGEAASLRFVQAFTDNLELESEDDSDEETGTGADKSGEDDTEGDIGFRDGEYDSDDPLGSGIEPPSSAEQSRYNTPILSAREVPSFSAGQAIHTCKPNLGQYDGHNETLLGGKEATSVVSASEVTTPRLAIESLPFLQETMQAMQDSSKRNSSMDADAIQALGQNIASQIAQFMQLAGDTKAHRKMRRRARDPLWDAPELPSNKRKAQRTPPTRLRGRPDELLAERESSAEQESIWAHVGSRRSRKRRKVQAAPASIVRWEGEDHSTTHESGIGYAVLAERNTWSDEQDRTMHDLAHAQHDSAVRPEEEPLRPDVSLPVHHTDWQQNLDPKLRDSQPEVDEAPALLDPATPAKLSSQTLLHHATEKYTANTGRRISGLVSTGLRGQRFSLDEDVLLLKLKEIESMSWEDVRLHFPGRSLGALQYRYYKRYEGGVSRKAHETLMAQGYPLPDINPPLAAECVTPDHNEDRHSSRAGGQRSLEGDREDALIHQLREDEHLSWLDIAKALPGRTASWVEQRYSYLCSHVNETAVQHGGNTAQIPLDTDRELGGIPTCSPGQFDKGASSTTLQQTAIQQRFPSNPLDRQPIVEQLAPNGKAYPRSSAFKYRIRYSQAEDDLLIYLRTVRKLSWQEIGVWFPSRGRNVLEVRWYEKLRYRLPGNRGGDNKTLDDPEHIPDAVFDTQLGQDDEATGHPDVSALESRDRPASRPSLSPEPTPPYGSPEADAHVQPYHSRAPLLRTALERSLRTQFEGVYPINFNDAAAGLDDEDSRPSIAREFSEREGDSVKQSSGAYDLPVGGRSAGNSPGNLQKGDADTLDLHNACPAQAEPAARLRDQRAQAPPTDHWGSRSLPTEDESTINTSFDGHDKAQIEPGTQFRVVGHQALGLTPDQIANSFSPLRHLGEHVREPSATTSNKTQLQGSRSNATHTDVHSQDSTTYGHNQTIATTWESSIPSPKGAANTFNVPPMHVNEAITLALQSTPSQQMKIVEMYEFLERHHPYYRQELAHQKLRTQLSLDKRFERVDNSRGGPWRLSGWQASTKGHGKPGSGRASQEHSVQDHVSGGPRRSAKQTSLASECSSKDSERSEDASQEQSSSATSCYEGPQARGPLDPALDGAMLDIVDRCSTHPVVEPSESAAAHYKTPVALMSTLTDTDASTVDNASTRQTLLPQEASAVRGEGTRHALLPQEPPVIKHNLRHTSLPKEPPTRSSTPRRTKRTSRAAPARYRQSLPPTKIATPVEKFKERTLLRSSSAKRSGTPKRVIATPDKAMENSDEDELA